MAIALLACSCFVEDISIGAHPVWSNDDAEVAFEVTWYEVRRGDLDESSSDQRRSGEEECEYFRVPADLSEEATSIGGRRSRCSEIYYMRTAGYLLTQTWDGDTATVWQLLLDGEERRIESSDAWPQPNDLGVDENPSLAAVPSPDGRFVLLSSVLDLEEFPGTAAYSHAKIVPIDAPETVVAALEVPESIGCRWQLDGSAICSSDGMGMRWEEGGDAFVPAEVNTCFGPLTSSSEVSSEGVVIEGGRSLDEPFYIAENGPKIPVFDETPFGCG